MNAPHEVPAANVPAVAVRLLCETLPQGDCDPVFLFDRNVIPADPRRIEGIVAPERGKEGIRQLLLSGAPRVYVGEAALLDGNLVETLVAEFGGNRIGLYLPVRRMQANWSMDTVSNADFRVMTPSVCEPCWEILRADGTRTGTHAAWWLGEMFERGAGSALIQADITDDADLNIVAGLTERWGGRLWLAPLEDQTPDFAAWVELGGARWLAVPGAAFQNSPYLATLNGVPAIEATSEDIG